MGRVEVEGKYLEGISRTVMALAAEAAELKRKETPLFQSTQTYSWFLQAEGATPGAEVLDGEAVNFAAGANSAAVFAAGKNVAVTQISRNISLFSGLSVRRGTDTTQGPRPRISFVDGANTAWGVADDSGGNEVDVDLSATILKKMKVRKNSTGVGVGPRPRLNLIEGNGLLITAADNSGDDEVDITLGVDLAGTGSVSRAARSDHDHTPGGIDTSVIITGLQNDKASPGVYVTTTLEFTGGLLTSAS